MTKITATNTVAVIEKIRFVVTMMESEMCCPKSGQGQF
jgi:hypothetical protein